MKFGFTKARGHYTHSTDQVDATGKPLWYVRPIPAWWNAFGRPTKRNGEEGYLSHHLFYPLAVLHSLQL